MESLGNAANAHGIPIFNNNSKLSNELPGNSGNQIHDPQLRHEN